MKIKAFNGVIIIVFLCALFSGCDRKAGKTDETAFVIQSQTAIESQSDNDYDTDSLHSFEKVISLTNDYMSMFRTEYTTDALDGENLRIIIEQADLDVQSTEGSTYNIYKKPDGDIIRACLVVYGETGKSITNFYEIKENMYVISKLTTYYSSGIMTAGFQDALNYTIEECFFDGTNFYIIDRISEKLIPSSDKRESDLLIIDMLKNNSSDIQ